MKSLAGVLLALSLTAPAVAAPAPVSLAVRESRTLQMMGVTAAWSVDPSIATASAVAGGLIITGHASGRTRVVVVSITGENSLEVTVAAGPANAARVQMKKTDQAVADVRYSSATREIHNDVTVTRQDKSRRTDANIHTVHQSSAARGDRPQTSVAAASYRVFTRGRELTILDREVDHSPLTLSGTAIRGAHYLDAHWSVHAGYTAYATWRSVLLPVERESVFGAAYAFGSSRTRFTPGIFAYPGKGTVLSLLYDHQPSDEELLRAEIGISREIGGALLYKRDSERDRVLADFRYRPMGFPMVGPGDLHGFVGDASWTRLYGRGSSFALAASATDLDRVGERVLAGSADAEQRIDERLTLTGGVSWGSFGDSHSLIVPAGVRIDLPHGSLGALYRYSEASTNSGGHGGRIFGRTSVGRLYASGYADRQQNAPTLEVIFSERPDLEVALRELGIEATTPADIARALRENASLVELGFIEGITVDLAPVRTQFGLEIAWLAPTAARDQLRARLTRNVIEGVATRNETTIASLMYSRRLTEATDIFASYSYWQTRRRGEDPRVQPYFELGLRQRFDGLPSFGGGTIEGMVFADEDLDGKSDGAGVVAEVDLDGAKTQVTRSDGTFAFRNVPRGSHRVSARVARTDAYFTTPSRVEAEPGDRLAFGVASTPGHVAGAVKTDVGDGIAGVRVILTRGAQQTTVTTDSEGHFASALPPGEWLLAIATDSVPPGYSLSGLAGRTLRLDRGKPQSVEWTLHALRSLTVTGAVPDTQFRLDPLGKTARADARGAFSVRSLPPGALTLSAGTLHRTIEVPRGPASLSITLAEPNPAPVTAEVRTLVSGETSDTLKPYVVNIGAFHVRSNAEETLAQARQAGVDARLATRGRFTVVRAFFSSRMPALKAAERLRNAGLEAVVSSTK